jgi:hypothetical protein
MQYVLFLLLVFGPSSLYRIFSSSTVHATHRKLIKISPRQAAAPHQQCYSSS